MQLPEGCQNELIHCWYWFKILKDAVEANDCNKIKWALEGQEPDVSLM